MCKDVQQFHKFVTKVRKYTFSGPNTRSELFTFSKASNKSHGLPQWMDWIVENHETLCFEIFGK